MEEGLQRRERETVAKTQNYTTLVSVMGSGQSGLEACGSCSHRPQQGLRGPAPQNSQGLRGAAPQDLQGLRGAAATGLSKLC